MAGPLVTFLSDFGADDEFVGVCHGVIAARCPDARIIDICHTVPRHDVRAGALMLCAALPYMPAGVHLAVVDPGVGMDVRGGRRAIALATADPGRVLVGPDNGLLLPAAERFGGVRAAAEISGSRARLGPVSATFHGRDLFSPVAAALARGEPLPELGAPLDPATLVALDAPPATVRDSALHCHVVHVDHFGNITTDATAAQLAQLGVGHGAAVAVRCGERALVATRRETFGEVKAGAALVHEDSRKLLAIAVNRGSAAETLGATAGLAVELRAAAAPGGRAS